MAFDFDVVAPVSRRASLGQTPTKGSGLGKLQHVISDCELLKYYAKALGIRARKLLLDGQRHATLQPIRLPVCLPAPLRLPGPFRAEIVPTGNSYIQRIFRDSRSLRALIRTKNKPVEYRYRRLQIRHWRAQPTPPCTYTARRQFLGWGV